MNESSTGPGSARPDRRGWRLTAGTAALMAVLVVAGSSGANTRTSSRSGRPTSTGNSAPRGATSNTALHGAFPVVNADGSTQVRQWQGGAVIAIDPLTLTVRSADGFTSSYLIGSGVSVAGIGLGDEVTIVGTGAAVARDV